MKVQKFLFIYSGNARLLISFLQDLRDWIYLKFGKTAMWTIIDLLFNKARGPKQRLINMLILIAKQYIYVLKFTKDSLNIEALEAIIVNSINRRSHSN